MLFIHRIWDLLVWFRFFLFCQVSQEQQQQPECYCFSRCFYRFRVFFLYTWICICFFALFPLFPHPFSRSIPGEKRTVASHRDNSGNSRGNKKIKVSCCCWAPWKKKRVSRHFTTGLFILKSYTNKIYREETGQRVGLLYIYNKRE